MTKLAASLDKLSFAKRYVNLFRTLINFSFVQFLVQVITAISGILLIRVLNKQDYAYFTIAFTMLGIMDLLADSGITGALYTQGGKIWNDKYKLGQLINTATQIRRLLAVGTAIIVTPISIWMLLKNEAGLVDVVALSTLIVIQLHLGLHIQILTIVPRLHSQIKQLQTLEFFTAILRLVLLLAMSLIFLNVIIAVLISVLTSIVNNLILLRWVRRNISTSAPVNTDYKHQLTKVFRSQIGNALYYCIQGQLVVWLIGIFGTTEQIAEVGALARLAIILTILGQTVQTIILPIFARCQDGALLIRRYWQILVGQFIVSLMIFGFVHMFSEQITWLLGKQYAGLERFIPLMTINLLFDRFTKLMWNLNLSKSWIGLSWLYAPMTILLQILLLFVLDVSTIQGVILFNLISILPWFFLNCYMSWNGLKKLKGASYCPA